MIVVADASPLQYLILVDQISLLERLYGSVFIPEAADRTSTCGHGLALAPPAGAGADEGLIDVREVLARLDATTFYLYRSRITREAVRQVAESRVG